nr:dynein assembly factor 5, axonemal [Leptinotarsa decemlineata]
MDMGKDQGSEDTIIDLKKMCLGLQSSDRKIRKEAYISIEKYLRSHSELSNQELRNIFSETYMYTLNGLRDKTESVREQAIEFVKFLIIEKLPINDYYLSYVFPLLVERIGSVELIEESEEIRLQMVKLLDAIITKYSNTNQLKPFLNDSVIILAEAVKDKFPLMKELSCRLILKLANALPRDFHCQAGNLIKPVLSCFGHQRYKIRVESIKAIGEIVMHCDHNGLNEVVGPLAERLFDQIPIVRQTVGQVAARWLLEYRDRYSFFHKILPLLLTGLNDEVVETRNEAAELWEQVGLQFQKENEKDLKDELDYLIDLPKYYPENIIRPNLGCRTLVKRNVSKLASALSRELMSWQEDVRVRCSQLLCAIVLHAEDGITQNLQSLLPAMYSAARDDDNRVVDNIIQASQLLGYFVRYNVWSDLIIPVIEDGAHYGHLIVLSGLVKGSPKEYIADCVEDISRVLAEDSICNSRKVLKIVYFGL